MTDVDTIINQALQTGDMSLLKKIKNPNNIDPIQKSQLLINNEDAFIFNAPCHKEMLKNVLYNKIEKIQTEEEARDIFDYIKKIRTDNLSKMFSDRRFKDNLYQALSFRFSQQLQEEVYNFLYNFEFKEGQ